MTRIYIDYTGSVSLKGKKFHGGSYYTKNVILSLLSKIKTKHEEFELNVFWPKNYDPIDEYENQICNSEYINLIYISDLAEVKNLERGSRIFIPLISIKRWKIFKTIKNNNPGTFLFLTIHGLRINDLKFDWYDRFYCDSFFKVFLEGVTMGVKKLYLRQLSKSCLKYIDKIFTVSNFTMQSILQITPVNWIKPYYEGVFLPNSDICSSPVEDFILFVSANRSEKNFVRAVEGFIEFKKKNSGELKMYVTGSNDIIRKKISDYFASDRELIEKYINFCGYVDNSVLENYYTQCKFLLYTSKSEGFGLPVLEVALRGKTAVVSSITSIPEVLGAAVYYVDPYNIHSIANGIEYMNDANNLRMYEQTVAKLSSGILNKIDINMEMLLFDILN